MTIESVTVLIVTYGDRWNYLSGILKSLNDYVKNIVVVNNDAQYDLTKKVEESNLTAVHIIDMGENTGSAFAIKSGLEYIQKNHSLSYVWILDDDNLPEPDALSVLLKTWNTENYETSNTMLVSIRENRKYLVKASQGHTVWQKNEFLGFDILNVIRKRIKKQSKENSESTITKIPFAPYGGMFFHTSLIDKIGLPNQDFFLYASDYDFSARLTKQGGNIMIVPDSKLIEVDAHWSSKTGDSEQSHMLGASPFRIYYMIRNTTYFWHTSMMTNPFLFHINRLIYTLRLRSESKKLGHQDNFKVYKQAVRDGLKGDLGKRSFGSLKNPMF